MRSGEQDMQEIKKSLGARLREPRRWVFALVVAVSAGLVWEAVGSALGDGNFDLSEGGNNMVITLVAALIVAFYPDHPEP